MVDMARETATIPLASDLAKELLRRVKEIEADVTKLGNQVIRLQNDLRSAEEHAETAEDRADEAESEAREATQEAELATTRLAELTASLERHVWLDDQPDRPTYCRQCGRTRPLHKVDCVFGAVD